MGHSESLRKDYAALTDIGEAFIYIAMTRLCATKRIAAYVLGRRTDDSC